MSHSSSSRHGSGRRTTMSPPTTATLGRPEESGVHFIKLTIPKTDEGPSASRYTTPAMRFKLGEDHYNSAIVYCCPLLTGSGQMNVQDNSITLQLDTIDKVAEFCSQSGLTEDDQMVWDSVLCTIQSTIQSMGQHRWFHHARQDGVYMFPTLAAGSKGALNGLRLELERPPHIPFADDPNDLDSIIPMPVRSDLWHSFEIVLYTSEGQEDDRRLTDTIPVYESLGATAENADLDLDDWE